VLWYGMTKIVKGMEHSVKQLSSWLPWAKNDEDMEWFSSPPADISSTLTSTMFPEFNVAIRTLSLLHGDQTQTFNGCKYGGRSDVRICDALIDAVLGSYRP
jgi:hypothetical protein